MKYDQTELISRPGCHLCGADHNIRSDYPNKLVIHKNLDKFDDKKRNKQLEEVRQRERKLKILPTVFLTPAKTRYICDGIQKFVKDEIIEIETHEKKLMTMLEEKEEKNKLLERENHNYKLEIDTLKHQDKLRQESNFRSDNKKMKSYNYNSQFQPVINQSTNTTTSNIEGNRLWANDLNVCIH